ECRRTETGVENPGNKRADANPAPTLRNHWGSWWRIGRSIGEISLLRLKPPAARVHTLAHELPIAVDAEGAGTGTQASRSWRALRACPSLWLCPVDRFPQIFRIFRTESRLQLLPSLASPQIFRLVFL